jgi:hypothetical protein
MPSLIVGCYRKLKVSFYNDAGQPTDPETVVIRITTPPHITEGTGIPVPATTLYTYSPGDVVRESVGVYYMIVQLNVPGLWKWFGKGTNVSGRTVIDEDATTLLVTKSAFPLSQQ